MRQDYANTARRRDRRTGLVAVLGLASLLLVPALTSAQQIGGTVTDTTGAALPGVTVEARSPALIEQVRTVVTDGTGKYLIVALVPGSYSVQFSLTGFRTVVREGIQLSTGFTASIDVQLPVGTVTETITVSGASPVVDVQNVSQRQVMNREIIDSIPTGKSISSYGLLVPGMVGAEHWGTPLSQDSGGMSVQSRQRMSIHGGNHEDQQLELNGLDVGDAFSQGANLSFFPDTNFEEMAFQYSGSSPVEAPIAITTGWAMRRSGFGESDGCEGSGQHVAFKRNRAERLAAGDPRLSLEERYTNHDGYVAPLRRQARSSRKSGSSFRPTSRSTSNRHDPAACFGRTRPDRADRGSRTSLGGAGRRPIRSLTGISGFFSAAR